jgi:iron transport multicopper oxidase
MLRSPFFVALAFVFATCITNAHAATVTSPGQLTISNGDISPDGFTRAATLVNGQIDGPLITASKVGVYRTPGSQLLTFPKGDTLQMTVVNSINDTTMYQGVTVVSILTEIHLTLLTFD